MSALQTPGRIASIAGFLRTAAASAASPDRDDVPPLNRTVFGWNFPTVIPDGEKESSIKASKFSEAQIVFVLRQAEKGTTIGEVCRKASVSRSSRSAPCRR
ncbi:transposase [Labrys miyagiensis]